MNKNLKSIKIWKKINLKQKLTNNKINKLSNLNRINKKYQKIIKNPKQNNKIEYSKVNISKENIIN